MTNNVKLKRVNFLVSKHCNLRCRMCDYRLGKMLSKHQLSFEQISTFLHEATELGLQELEVSGGEPMLRTEIFDIIALSKKLGLKTLMMSNGVLIGDVQAEMLAECGLNGIVISLEGFEDLNDKIRGLGSYKKAVEAIKHLQKYPDQIELVKVGITLTRSNYTTIYQFIRHLVEELGVKNISINPYNSAMLLEKNRISRSEEFDVSEDIIPYIQEELNKINDYAKKEKVNIPPESYLAKIPDYFRGYSMVPASGCPDPLMGCNIDSEGDVYPCWGDKVYMGNLRDNSIKDILQSEKYIQFCNDALNGRCKGCLQACHAQAHAGV